MYGIYKGNLTILSFFISQQSNDNKPLITPKLDEADALAKQQEDTLVARYDKSYRIVAMLVLVCSLTQLLFSF